MTLHIIDIFEKLEKPSLTSMETTKTQTQGIPKDMNKRLNYIKL
jgi:hypothetical protein